MYYKLLILLVLTGCLSAASDLDLSESTNATANTPEIENLIQDAANSSAGSDSNSTESTNSTKAPIVENSTQDAANSSTSSNSNSTETTNSTNAPEVRNSTQSVANSSAGSDSNSTESTNSTNATGIEITTQLPTTTSRSTRLPRPHRPRPPPPPFRPSLLLASPLIANLLKAINNFARSNQPVNRGRYIGGRRIPRIRRAEINLNGSGSLKLPSAESLASYSALLGIDPQILNEDNIVPQIPGLSNSSNPETPKISNLPSPLLIPELQDAVERARKIVANRIRAGDDLVSGIQNAIQNGLSSPNPTRAIRRLIATILRAYLVVARNCPVFIVSRLVLREGLVVTSEILRNLANVSAQAQEAV